MKSLQTQQSFFNLERAELEDLPLNNGWKKLGSLFCLSTLRHVTIVTSYVCIQKKRKQDIIIERQYFILFFHRYVLAFSTSCRLSSGCCGWLSTCDIIRFFVRMFYDWMQGNVLKSLHFDSIDISFTAYTETNRQLFIRNTNLVRKQHFPFPRYHWGVSEAVYSVIIMHVQLSDSTLKRQMSKK